METSIEIAQKESLEILNKHFSAKPYEKYSQAMLNHYAMEAYHEVLGKNHSKKRVSERKEREIRNCFIAKLQERYGKWVNVKNFRIKGRGSISYNSNFSIVFTTPEGKLYRAASRGVSRDVFFTTHCLERSEERIDPSLIAPYTKWLEKKIRSKPTTFDILSGLIFVERDFEHAIVDKSWYLNLKVGVLVMENHEHIFVAKTILAPHMEVEEAPWFRPQLTPEMQQDPNPFTWSIKAILRHNPIRVQRTVYNLDSLEEVLARFDRFYRPE